MTFLSGLFLLALPLILVPVAIHLYRGRQRDVIPWGAMRFLEQAATKGRSLQRLEELLLMLLRVATVVALVLALARPMIRSTWWNQSTDREVVLIVDDSLSMAREVAGVSANDLLIDNARKQIDSLAAGDDVHVLLASGGGRWLTAEAISANSEGKGRLRNLLEVIAPTRGQADLLGCLLTAVNLDSSVNPASRQIVVLTDDQASSWQLDSQGAWQQLGAAQRRAPIPTEIEVVDCSLTTEEFENLAVMQLEASGQFARPDQRVNFKAEIANVGNLASDDTHVEWLVGEDVFATSELPSLAPDEQRQVTADLRWEERGHLVVSCRIKADDQLALDQQESVVLEVSDELPILFVYEPESDATKTTDELVLAALGYQIDSSDGWQSVYSPTVVSPKQLEQEVSLSNYHAVVIASLSDLSRDVIERLDTYTRGGGGLWIALGENTDREDFNRQWYDDGAGLSPLPIDVLQGVDDNNSPSGMIHPPSREHAATAQLANTTQLDVDEARLTEYWRFRVSTEAGVDTSVLLESGDGNPLVIENYVGQGRVIVQAFPLGLEWGNLPQLKSYVVMILDWLDYLTAPAKSRFNLDPSHEIVASVPPGLELIPAELHTPDGTSVQLLARDSADGGELKYTGTQLPGSYRVVFDPGGPAETNLPYQVRRTASESHLEKTDEEQRSELFAAAGLRFAKDSVPEAETEATDKPTKLQPIWGLLLALLLGLLAVELLLSSWLARQRSGVAVSTN